MYRFSALTFLVRQTRQACTVHSSACSASESRDEERWLTFPRSSEGWWPGPCELSAVPDVTDSTKLDVVLSGGIADIDGTLGSRDS